MAGNLVSYALVSLVSVSLVAQQMPEVPTSSDPKVAATQPEQPKTGDHILEDGTPVKLRLARSLSSADARAGQEIPFEVMDDVDVDGVTVLHRGAAAIGVVTDADSARKMDREGKLSFRLSYLTLADEEKAALRSFSHSKGHSGVSDGAALGAYAAGGLVGLFVLTALTKGTNVLIPHGTKITAFVDGDMHLDLSKFGAPTQSSSQEPAPQGTTVQASLVVDSAPAGADVEVDGRLVGSTPLTVTLAAGGRQIVVKKKGFTDWSKTVHVTGGTVHVNAVLEQSPAH